MKFLSLFLKILVTDTFDNPNSAGPARLISYYYKGFQPTGIESFFKVLAVGKNKLKIFFVFQIQLVLENSWKEGSFFTTEFAHTGFYFLPNQKRK